MNWSRLRSKFSDSDRIVPSPSRNTFGPSHGFLVGQSCSCLIVCWPVKSYSCLIVGRLAARCLGRSGGVTEVVSEHGFVHASGIHDLIGFKYLSSQN